MAEYHCSHCGAAAYYDGRCGDGPILTCGCDETGEYVDEGSRGGYYVNENNAQPVKGPPRRRGRNPYDKERR